MAVLLDYQWDSESTIDEVNMSLLAALNVEITKHAASHKRQATAPQN